jgi:hypothetical protein
VDGRPLTLPLCVASQSMAAPVLTYDGFYFSQTGTSFLAQLNFKMNKQGKPALTICKKLSAHSCGRLFLLLRSAWIIHL